MIKMPLDQIISKIKEKAGVSEEEILAKIDEKLKQLSGLISKEGAGHIIANELGVKLFDQVQGKLDIANVLPGMRDVEIAGKVQRVSSVTRFQRKDGGEGKVANVELADESGSIRVVLWGDHAEQAGSIKADSVVKVVSGYVRENNNMPEVHLNDRSKIEVNPDGVTIGEVKKITASRKTIAALEGTDQHVELLGTVVQVFEPRFFEVDPDSGRRVRASGDGNFTTSDGKVVTKPGFSYVLNAVLDDGTETIRGVFFRKQAEELLGINEEGIMVFKDKPEDFEEVKTRLLGNIVKVVGRAKTNEMFDRLEFVSQFVDPKPDAKEELARLQQEGTPVAPAAGVEEPVKASAVAGGTLEMPEEEVVGDAPGSVEAAAEDKSLPEKKPTAKDSLPSVEDI